MHSKCHGLKGFHIRLNAKKHHQGPHNSSGLVKSHKALCQSHKSLCQSHKLLCLQFWGFSTSDFQPQTCLWPPQSVRPTTTQTATSVPSSQVISNNAVKRSEIWSDTTLNYGQTCRDSLTIQWPIVKPAGTVWHYTDLWSNLQWESDTTQTYGKTCRGQSDTTLTVLLSNLQGQSDTTLTYSQTCKESLTLHWTAVKPAGTVWHYTELRSNLQGQSDTTLTCGQTCRDSLTRHWTAVKPAGTV